jgi:pimeloyl-ACP methyl ester carboxylesterase
MTIPFRETGNGRPVVLLHAFPLDSSMWEPNAGAIAAEGFRVIMPDLPGFGRNSNFSEISSLDEMASGVKDLLDSLEVEEAIFAGLSMGGYVLFSFLRQFPNAVSAMVLCDTTAGSDTEEKRQGRYQLIERLTEEGSEVLVEVMLSNLLSSHTLRNNSGVAGTIAEKFRGCDWKAAAAALRGMALRPDSRDLLADCGLSTLLIYGEDDSVTGLDAAKEINGLMRNSRLQVIPGAGHYSNVEKPQEFNKAFISFLKSLPANN